MKLIIEILDRGLQLEIIKQGHAHLQKVTQTVETEATFKFELIGLAYAFLKKHTLRSEEAQMFREILSDNELNSLKDINSYNYHKLKLK